MFDHLAPHVSQLSKLEEERLDIKVYLDSYCRSAIAELAMASSDIFSSVKHLSLFVGKHDSWVPLYNAFSCVTELTLDAYKIDLTALHIDNKEEKQYILFPQLRSLRVMLVTNTIPPSILDFMENRAGVGLPLSCLHLLVDDTEAPIALSDTDKERLANLPGLTVKLRLTGAVTRELIGPRCIVENRTDTSMGVKRSVKKRERKRDKQKSLLL
ncbi:hypothetical protein CPC08DRAFT_731053 [Agrocybe pediades]|nr:hypothetical protein CPC08DRAFT_731053 [Agrocybe pediades]